MRSLNPFEGEFYRETLQVSRMKRDLFCLMEGRHVHPSTLYHGDVGTVPAIQVCTDYLVRLRKFLEFTKKVVPLHDDLFGFFYEALPGHEEVGRRRVLLGCWGSLQNPAACELSTRVGGMRVVDMLSGEQLPRIC
jgi:hydrogenase large subunit